jgi:5-methylcytosine-specific restriction endonuclease McrA
MCYRRHRAAVLKIYNHCCAWCGILDYGIYSSEELCLDHIKPQMIGGGDGIENLQILCRRCNSIKGPYYLPKLPPRMPAANLAEAVAAQEKLKRKIMPARRRSGCDDWKPRSTLGY